MIAGVHSDDIERLWPAVCPLVQRVLDRYDFGFDADYIKAKLLNRDMQLWVCAGDAIAITEIIVLPQFKVLGVPVIAGEGLKDWLPDLVETLKAFGKDHGCKYMDGYGRKGWLKALDKYGFKPYSISTRCEL